MLVNDHNAFSSFRFCCHHPSSNTGVVRSQDCFMYCMSSAPTNSADGVSIIGGLPSLRLEALIWDSLSRWVTGIKVTDWEGRTRGRRQIRRCIRVAGWLSSREDGIYWEHQRVSKKKDTLQGEVGEPLPVDFMWWLMSTKLRVVKREARCTPLHTVISSRCLSDDSWRGERSRVQTFKVIMD